MWRPTTQPSCTRACGNLALAGLLVYIARRWRLRPGQLFVGYVAGYAAGRLWVEALRVDPATEIAGVRVNIWVSSTVLLVAIAVLVIRSRAGRAGVTLGPVGAETEQLSAPSCQDVARMLQSFLDREVDEGSAERVAAHLEMCRHCGLEADVYREIKASLSRSTPTVSELTLRRLRHFGEELNVGASGPPRGTSI